MATLEFVSYLSHHLDPTAVELATHVGDHSGVAVVFDDGRSMPERRKMIDDGQADIVWMCGYSTRLSIDLGQADLEIVAAPIFGGETEPVYHSVIVVRSRSNYRRLTDLRGSRLVINEKESWSGHHALMEHLDDSGCPRPFFGSITESGSHRASLEHVVADAADCAAIDSTVWNATEGDIDGLRIVDRTRDWPAPPFSLNRRLDPALRKTIREALTTSPGTRFHRSIVPVSGQVYERMVTVK